MCAVSMLTACTNQEAQLKDRASELCRYVPDHELLGEAREYMTADFYSVLDTMFNFLPAHDALEREWLYYFVTGNGGTKPVFEVAGVEQTDATHAVATILVKQVWEEEVLEPDPASDAMFFEAIEAEAEQHRLYMEKQNGRWLMSDFDEHKAECISYLANYRQEQAVRDAISDYLVRALGPGYLQGDLCIPALVMVAAEENDSTNASVWGDFYITWYHIAGDTLKTVSGGSHAGRMTIQKQDERLVVTDFEQTTDGAGNDESARRIFGSHYEMYHYFHSNNDVREAIRAEQLGDYIHKNHLPFHYYQDYGWEAVKVY